MVGALFAQLYDDNTKVWRNIFCVLHLLNALVSRNPSQMSNFCVYLLPGNWSITPTGYRISRLLLKRAVVFKGINLFS